MSLISISFLSIGTIGGIGAILFAIFLWFRIKRLSTGEGKANEIFKYIRAGAKAYIRREFITILIIAAILSIIIWITLGWAVSVSYVIGTITSLLASFIGMDLATRTNVRVTLQGKNSLLAAMKTAFNGGTIMGFLVFGVNIIQIVITFSIFYFLLGWSYNMVMMSIVGCAFGSSFTSVVAQLGGGIYTKGADIGADIVGKIEAGIPEDDHRNPAVIADAVGDNVGDCAGRSADLYETLTSEIISSMILGIALATFITDVNISEMVIFFPFILRSWTVIATIIGYVIVVSSKNISTEKDTWRTLNRGLYLSSILIGLFYIIMIYVIFNSGWYIIAAVLGIGANLIMGILVEKYTGFDSKSVKEISKESETGAATNIISGMANGLRAVFIPLAIIAIFILISYGMGLIYGYQNGFTSSIETAGIYGIVIMSMGMTSGTGIILSMDGFGPISDNAGGIAEMASLEPELRDNIDKLDATGNSTKSLTKGFSIITGTTIGFITIFAYLQLLENKSLYPIINIGLPQIAVGGIFAIITVFMFVSMLMRAVGKTAFDMIEEVRRQFREKPGIMENKVLPDYDICVDISTKSALKNMILPSILIIIMPIIVGIFLGPFTAGAFLIVGTFTGGAMGLFLNIAGASWDNAKKLRKTLRDKSKPETIEAYKAAIIGDTVGDPCKDTAGSSLGSFVTTINNMALTFFPLFIQSYTFFMLIITALFP